MKLNDWQSMQWFQHISFIFLQWVLCIHLRIYYSLRHVSLEFECHLTALTIHLFESFLQKCIKFHSVIDKTFIFRLKESFTGNDFMLLWFSLFNQFISSSYCISAGISWEKRCTCSFSGTEHSTESIGSHSDVPGHSGRVTTEGASCLFCRGYRPKPGECHGEYDKID